MFQAGPLYADEHGGVLLGGEHGHDHAASSLPFALPGRWTGGRREVDVSFLAMIFSFFLTRTVSDC